MCDPYFQVFPSWRGVSSLAWTWWMRKLLSRPFIASPAKKTSASYRYLKIMFWDSKYQTLFWLITWKWWTGWLLTLPQFSTQAPMNRSVINEDDSWLLDGGKGNNIFVYNPASSTSPMRRFKVNNFANTIRDNEHAGNTEVTILGNYKDFDVNKT